MKFLPIIVIVIALAIGAFLFLGSKGGNAPAPTAGQPTATAPAAPGAATTPAAPAQPVPEMSKEQLLKEAGNAFREKRYVAPAGNNAYEYYLRVLDKEPGNTVSKDALREMFPFATPIVEADINGNNLDEATREIDLLGKADPSNYTLTILRGKLDAKKKQAEKEQAQAAAAAAAAAAKAAAAAQAPPATAPAATAAATPPPAAAAPPKPTPAAPAPPPVAEAPAPAAPAGETHPAQLVKSAAPAYPPEAVRSKKDGWVQVEFTVDANGNVTDAKVANADPPRLFNTAALDAVRRWSFKPRMENGKAVEERMSRRIEFKLGGG